MLRVSNEPAALIPRVVPVESLEALMGVRKKLRETKTCHFPRGAQFMLFEILLV